MSIKHLSGLKALGAALRKDMKGVERKVGTTCVKTCKAGVNIVKKKLPRQDSIKKGLEAEKTSTGAILHSTAPHSGYVEEGTRPHHIPMDPLIAWATEKGFSDPAAMAKAVQKKIEAVGTTPLYFMRNSIPEMNAFFDATLKALLAGD